MKSPEEYVRPNIRALSPYSTARDEFKGGDISVWLDANESPYNTRLAGCDVDINRYPDPHQHRLKQRIAALKGVAPDCLFIGGAGSDEAIDLIYRIFCTPGHDNVVAMSPTYGVYRVAADINDVEYREVPLMPGYTLDAEAMLAACDTNTKVMWLCSPNNPTGNAFAVDEIISLADRFNGILAVDEAYVDFSAKGSVLPHIAAHPNIIVLQTFSKARGMASMRLGIAVAVPELARYFAMAKYPYNVNGPTQRIALDLVGRDISGQVSEIVAQRHMLEKELPALPGIMDVYPSDANFLLVKVDDPARMYDYLVDNGVIVRNRDNVPGCAGCLRITVGTVAENGRLLSLLASGYSDYASITSPGMNHPHLADISPSVPRGSVAGSEEVLPARSAEIHRVTRETDISVYINLDGGETSHISTGLGFFDHMLWQLPHHGGISLRLQCRGDLHVDEHHTIEDVGIVLGQAIVKALGDKRGIDRYGFVLPMDECRAMVLMDFSGRSSFEWSVPFTREYVGDVPTEMFSHFFKSMADAMQANVHISASGENNHHLVEAVFKAFSRALKAAVHRQPFNYDLPSSKGLL